MAAQSIPRSTAQSASGTLPSAPTADTAGGGAPGAARPAAQVTSGAQGIFAAATTLTAAAPAAPVGTGFPPSAAAAALPAAAAAVTAASRAATEIASHLNGLVYEQRDGLLDARPGDSYLRGLPKTLQLNEVLITAVSNKLSRTVQHLLRFHRFNTDRIEDFAFGKAFGLAVANDNAFVVRHILEHILVLIPSRNNMQPLISRVAFNKCLEEMQMGSLDLVLRAAVRRNRPEVVHAVLGFEDGCFLDARVGDIVKRRDTGAEYINPVHLISDDTLATLLRRVEIIPGLLQTCITERQEAKDAEAAEKAKAARNVSSL